MRLALGQVHRRRRTRACRGSSSAVSCAMFRSPTVTARVSGRSRAPLHARHGISRMNCSSLSRAVSESVSAWRRSMFGIGALVGGPVGALPVVAVLVPDVDRLVGPVEQDLALGLRPACFHGASRSMSCAAPTASRTRYQYSSVAAGPRRERALVHGQVGVGDDQLGVDLEPGAEAVARGARAVRRVEREVPRVHLVEREPAVRAREALREGLDLLVALVGGARRSTAIPSASSRAVSIESATRRRMSRLATSRSTTTSIVCL